MGVTSGGLSLRLSAIRLCLTPRAKVGPRHPFIGGGLRFAGAKTGVSERLSQNLKC